MASSPPSVIVRSFQYGDEKQVRRILHKATMGTTWPMFFSFAKREITSQSILILAAVLFVIIGLPLAHSLISIPIVLLLLAISTWLGHRLKIFLTHNDLIDIGQGYQSNPKCGFWVAEIVDKDALISSPNKAKIVRKEGNKSHGREIIGTIAVTIKEDPDLREPPESVAWIRRMAVSPKYHRKGIGMALTDVALDHCARANFRAVELLTTEFHQAARSLYATKGFELIETTRKTYLGGLLSFSLYRLRVASIQLQTRCNLNA